jgi:thymidylate synthase (FAD)
MNQIKVELQEWMGSDRSIANAAWTSSFDKEKRDNRSEEQVNNLVRRLAIDKHATPFESVVLRFWIKMPIFIDREHMTHRIASHNGQSARYRTMPKEWYEIPQDVKNILEKANTGSNEFEYYFINCYNKLMEDCNDLYREILEKAKFAEENGKITNEEYKRTREVFRGLIPTGNLVERTTIMNLRAFANYQKLRNSVYAQPEIQRVAQLMLTEVEEKKVCPIALDALKMNGWNI